MIIWTKAIQTGKIIDCPQCEGKGYEKVTESGYGLITINCTKCGGACLIIGKMRTEKIPQKTFQKVAE